MLYSSVKISTNQEHTAEGRKPFHKGITEYNMYDSFEKGFENIEIKTRMLQFLNDNIDTHFNFIFVRIIPQRYGTTFQINFSSLGNCFQ